MKPLGLTSARKPRTMGVPAAASRKRKPAGTTTKGPTYTNNNDDEESAGAEKTKRIKKEGVQRQKEKSASMRNGKLKVKREDSADEGDDSADEGEERELRSSDIDGDFEYDDENLADDGV
jgi:hypothetical protein